MQLEAKTQQTILRQLAWSAVIYALPVLLMFAWFYWTGQRPWNSPGVPLTHGAANVSFLRTFLHKYWLTLFVLALGIVEFSFGLYEARWTKNERFIDIVCFAAPHLITGPAIALFTTKALPFLLPGLRGQFSWVPFMWGFLIICIADDLTQYWYHRLHHQIPWLWRFHRTHHSASYMGMAMASRQNLWYTIFFSQIYVTAALVYLGLGASAAVALVIKSVITTLAHSSIPWDKPLYKFRVLHPAAWVLERLISTPATHHAHHADTTDDGVGYYKGNFGNMFFLWDVIFGTAHISRLYPSSYGISHYAGDPWQAQFLWPVFKSPILGSELAADGPDVREDIRLDQEKAATVASPQVA
jgi:sterol desaturase/sphingolipid hydroxylase (fatty acid hydroxylase superfamily)